MGLERAVSERVLSDKTLRHGGKMEIIFMEDEKIVDLYWARNEDAIRETDVKYGRFLHSVSYNILINHEDSLECVNDTYLKAWNSMPPNRPVKLNLYLSRIIRYTSIDRLRRRMGLKQKASEYSVALAELDQYDSGRDVIGEKIDSEHLTALIEAFLSTLPNDTRNIFVGRYFFMDSVKEIAKITHCSVSKVKTSLYRTRMELKEYLIKEGIEL